MHYFERGWSLQVLAGSSHFDLNVLALGESIEGFLDEELTSSPGEDLAAEVHGLKLAV